MQPHPDNFERLDIEIPEYTGDSHPFSKGQNPQFYRVIKDPAEGRTLRTTFFEKNLVGLYWALGRPVPYAFRTRDGTVRSLDAGCVQFLFNRRPPEVEYVRDPDEYIIAVKPLEPLLERFQEDYRSAIAPYSRLAKILALPFDVDSPVDERRRVISEQVRRDGAVAFRRDISHAWGTRCAISGVRISQVLDAAHIFPYFGAATNDLRNGIMLKSDLHILFDAHLLSLEYVSGALRVRASKRLRDSPYSKYHDKAIDLPHDLSHQPAPDAVRKHFEEFQQMESKEQT
ncbi:HNH endonuclease [Bradyrhizobium sp. 131]|uniref:HNH endonuclease n=1 Tax=Bradyrhizobium sp. 131 TaxID=2782609 RepID=UPI001FFFEE13|nr:HNH endonuclease [Bradyrhizobium sp. 131]UPK17590.1 HNH endonuclease [Bradyrhizobium sp. 131]